MGSCGTCCYTIPTLESYKTGGFGMGKKLVRQVPMTKDVKIVKNIKKSVRVFMIFVPTAIYLCRNQYILCRVQKSTAFGTQCTTQDENQPPSTQQPYNHNSFSKNIKTSYSLTVMIVSQKNVKNFLCKQKIMNNCSIPSTHAERQINNLSVKHSFTLYPSLSPYSQTE